MPLSAQRKLKIAPSRAVAKPSKNFLNLPGCEVTETGLTIAPGLKLETWESIGDALKRVESGVQWWLGDWMIYGEREYQSQRSQAIEVSAEIGVNKDTIRNYQWVSESVDPAMRIATLPWSFHQLVAALPPKAQSKWLNKAKERKDAGEGYTFRELKREIETSERVKKFSLVNAILEKVWDRIEDGCYTAEAILKCSECNNNIFGLEQEEIQLYMQQLVGSGRAEWRNQGGKTDVASGSPTKLCVPKGMPAGSDLDLGRKRNGDDDGEEHY